MPACHSTDEPEGTRTQHTVRRVTKGRPTTDINSHQVEVDHVANFIVVTDQYQSYRSKVLAPNKARNRASGLRSGARA
jgi:hypothetical protein